VGKRQSQKKIDLINSNCPPRDDKRNSDGEYKSPVRGLWKNQTKGKFLGRSVNGRLVKRTITGQLVNVRPQMGSGGNFNSARKSVLQVKTPTDSGGGKKGAKTAIFHLRSTKETRCGVKNLATKNADPRSGGSKKSNWGKPGGRCKKPKQIFSVLVFDTERQWGSEWSTWGPRPIHLVE